MGCLYSIPVSSSELTEISFNNCACVRYRSCCINQVSTQKQQSYFRDKKMKTDGWSDRQMAFHLYIVDSTTYSSAGFRDSFLQLLQY